MPHATHKYPLISVITVSFNAVYFIEQTIQSVLFQTYPNIEYIVIDGSSTDGTVDIIRKYENRLAYWHSKPDRGLAHAFNLGFSHCHGEWIVYLNADDFFLGPSVVEDMVPYLILHNGADIVFGDVIIMSVDKEPHPVPLNKICASPWSWHKIRFWGMFSAIPHQSTFTSRRCFEHLGNFDESFKISVDYEFFLRAGKHLKAQYVRVPVSGMRHGGMSGKNVINTFHECRLALQKTAALPDALAWMSFFLMIGRYHLSRLAHKILDHWASQITWPGRMSGKLS